MESSWDNFRIGVESLWGHVGFIWGTSWDHWWVIWGFLLGARWGNCREAKIPTTQLCISIVHGDACDNSGLGPNTNCVRTTWSMIGQLKTTSCRIGSLLIIGVRAGPDYFHEATMLLLCHRRHRHPMGTPWGPMETPWDSWGPHGDLWDPMGTHGEPMGSHGDL